MSHSPASRPPEPILARIREALDPTSGAKTYGKDRMPEPGDRFRWHGIEGPGALGTVLSRTENVFSYVFDGEAVECYGTWSYLAGFNIFVEPLHGPGETPLAEIPDASLGILLEVMLADAVYRDVDTCTISLEIREAAAQRLGPNFWREALERAVASTRSPAWVLAAHLLDLTRDTCPSCGRGLATETDESSAIFPYWICRSAGSHECKLAANRTKEAV